MISLNPHFRELLKSLNSAGVRYLVLGGYAVNFHGYHRNTKDIDIWIAVDGDNPNRLSKALKQFGFAAANVPPEQFAVKGQIYTFGREPFRVDILSDASGIDSRHAILVALKVDWTGSLSLSYFWQT